MSWDSGKNKYLGAWHYVGLSILYAIPVLGWILLIFDAFNGQNENRKHYARSFFARALVTVILVLAALAALYALKGADGLTQLWNDTLKDIQNRWESLKVV